MSYQIIESSPESKRIAENGHERKTGSQYPFEELNVGMSFAIPLGEANVASLRALAHRKSKEGKRFVVVKHPDLLQPLVEVARVE